MLLCTDEKKQEREGEEEKPRWSRTTWPEKTAVYVFVYTRVPKKPREDTGSPRAGVIYSDGHLGGPGSSALILWKSEPLEQI